MALAHQIKFSELSSLLEYVSTTKAMDKREARFTEFFVKLHKYRDEYKNKNPDQVKLELKYCRSINTIHFLR